MKNCSQCGHENPDEAVICGKCGTAISPPTISGGGKKESVPVKKYWLLRVFIAVCVWIVISSMSLHVGWQQANHARMAWFEQWRTKDDLTYIRDAIAAYQGKNKSSPSNFEQLVTNGDLNPNDWPFSSSGGFIDGWQRPLMLTNVGTNCFVISYGQDGKPGGTGIDFDLTSINPNPKEASPTFAQFYDNPRCGQVVVSSIVCGALAGLLSLLTVRIPDLRIKGIVVLVLSLAATVIGTFWTASIITILHIPSGH